MNILKNYILRYRRYVDDGILIMKENEIDQCLNVFNGYNENLKFTMKREVEQKISYLEVELIRDGTPL